MALTSCLSSEQLVISRASFPQELFWAADVPLGPARHQERLSDAGATHQTAIRALLATRRTPGWDASCRGAVPSHLAPWSARVAKGDTTKHRQFFVFVFVAAFVLSKQQKLVLDLRLAQYELNKKWWQVEARE